MEEEEEELKASGNAAFKKGAFASAVDFFSRAIDASSKKKKNIENHHVLYSNRSAARVRRIIVFLFICFWESVFFGRRSNAQNFGVFVGRSLVV